MAANRKALVANALALLCGPSLASGQEAAPYADDVIIKRMTRSAMAELRRRGWALFDEVRAANLPSSDEWLTEAEAFGDPSCKPAGSSRPWPMARPAEREWLESAKNVPSTELEERLLFEGTFYNVRACLDIHNEEFPLNDFDTTKRLLASQRREIDEFHPDAKVIKTFWRPVPMDNAEVHVGVWQWPTSPGVDTLEDRREAQWRRDECVQLEPETGSPCLKAADFFYTAQATCGKACPKGLRHGQELILLAVHVISKESPDWLWATYWWKGGAKFPRTSGSSWTCDNAQRPRIAGPWANYSMNVTNSFKLARPQVRADDIATCGVPGTIGLPQHKEESLATYNPFVEGVMPGGRKSSCIVCHARASTRGDTGVRPFRIPPVGRVEWPAVTEFEGHIRTDYLWSVRDHIGPSKEP